MKTIFFRRMPVVSFLILFTLVLFSCKREDLQKESFDQQSVLDRLIKQARSRGYVEITPIYKKAPSILYYDKKGIEHFLSLGGNNGSSNFSPITTPCDGGLTNCDNADGDPSLLQSPDIVLESSTRISNCGNAGNSSTSDIKVSWQISVPYNIIAAASITQPSRGRLRFRNSSNVVVQSYLTVTPISILNLGADPTCTDRTVFQITYTQTGISNSNFATGITMEHNFFLYTDCHAQTSFTLTSYLGSPTPILSGAPAGFPCSRTDELFIANGGPSGCGSAQGVGLLIGCPFPSGWVYPSSQYLEYRPYNSTGAWYNKTISPFSFANMLEMTAGSGRWQIRYRNHLNSPACDGPWYYTTYLL